MVTLSSPTHLPAIEALPAQGVGAITPQGGGALEPQQFQNVGLSFQCAWCVLDISGSLEPHHWFPAQPVPSTLEPGSDLDSAWMARLPSVSSMEGAGGVLCVQAPTGAVPGHIPTGAAMNPTSNPTTVSSEASPAVETHHRSDSLGCGGQNDAGAPLPCATHGILLCFALDRV